jgi:hypothetical protein
MSMAHWDTAPLSQNGWPSTMERWRSSDCSIRAVNSISLQCEVSARRHPVASIAVAAALHAQRAGQTNEIDLTVRPADRLARLEHPATAWTTDDQIACNPVQRQPRAQAVIPDDLDLKRSSRHTGAVEHDTRAEPHRRSRLARPPLKSYAPMRRCPTDLRDPYITTCFRARPDFELASRARAPRSGHAACASTGLALRTRRPNAQLRLPVDYHEFAAAFIAPIPRSRRCWQIPASQIQA